jgi:hypothetical protein
VASRRFAGGDPGPEGDVDAAITAIDAGSSPHHRAAAIAALLLQRRVFSSAAAETALLAMTCQLRRDGFELVAPQGAVVGMVQGLASGRMDEPTVARWLEDRAMPLGVG